MKLLELLSYNFWSARIISLVIISVIISISTILDLRCHAYASSSYISPPSSDTPDFIELDIDLTPNLHRLSSLYQRLTKGARNLIQWPGSISSSGRRRNYNNVGAPKPQYAPNPVHVQQQAQPSQLQLQRVKPHPQPQSVQYSYPKPREIYPLYTRPDRPNNNAPNPSGGFDSATSGSEVVEEYERHTHVRDSQSRPPSSPQSQSASASASYPLVSTYSAPSESSGDSSGSILSILQDTGSDPSTSSSSGGSGGIQISDSDLSYSSDLGSSETSDVLGHFPTSSSSSSSSGGSSISDFYSIVPGTLTSSSSSRVPYSPSEWTSDSGSQPTKTYYTTTSYVSSSKPKPLHTPYKIRGPSTYASGPIKVISYVPAKRPVKSKPSSQSSWGPPPLSSYGPPPPQSQSLKGGYSPGSGPAPSSLTKAYKQTIRYVTHGYGWAPPKPQGWGWAPPPPPPTPGWGWGPKCTGNEPPISINSESDVPQGSTFTDGEGNRAVLEDVITTFVPDAPITLVVGARAEIPPNFTTPHIEQFKIKVNVDGPPSSEREVHHQGQGKDPSELLGQGSEPQGEGEIRITSSVAVSPYVAAPINGTANDKFDIGIQRRDMAFSQPPREPLLAQVDDVMRLYDELEMLLTQQEEMERMKEKDELEKIKAGVLPKRWKRGASGKKSNGGSGSSGGGVPQPSVDGDLASPVTALMVQRFSIPEPNTSEPGMLSAAYNFGPPASRIQFGDLNLVTEEWMRKLSSDPQPLDTNSLLLDPSGPGGADGGNSQDALNSRIRQYLKSIRDASGDSYNRAEELSYDYFEQKQYFITPPGECQAEVDPQKVRGAISNNCAFGSVDLNRNAPSCLPPRC